MKNVGIFLLGGILVSVGYLIGTLHNNSVGADGHALDELRVRKLLAEEVVVTSGEGPVVAINANANLAKIVVGIVDPKGIQGSRVVLSAHKSFSTVVLTNDSSSSDLSSVHGQWLLTDNFCDFDIRNGQAARIRIRGTSRDGVVTTYTGNQLTGAIGGN